MLSTPKLIGSIDREVRLLVTSMDECAMHLAASYPDAGLTVHKVPDRLVLQSGTVGVSVSLFRSRANLEASAEVVLAVWHGEVTVPGSAPREGRHAVRVSMRQFRIMACGGEAWLWMDEETTTTMTSQALAAACIEAMAEQLSRCPGQPSEVDVIPG